MEFLNSSEVETLKKLIITCEILVLFIFIVKIVMVGGLMKNSEPSVSVLSVNQALADSPAVTGHNFPVKEVCEDNLLMERKLLDSLLEKQKEIQNREDKLKSEEKNLNSLKNEILSKIDKLRETEKRLTVIIESIKEVDGKKYKNLAKIYESSPPAQASSMLEKMDKKTAAAIIMNMRRKEA